MILFEKMFQKSLGGLIIDKFAKNNKLICAAMKKIILFTLLAVSLTFTSCTEKIGGNADMSTIEFTVYNSDWVEYGAVGEAGYGFAVDLSMPEITDNVIHNGMVSLYMKYGESWIPVPVYFYNTGFQGGYFYTMKRGVFSIEYYESDHQTVKPESQIFRLVIVQPY